MFCLKKSLILIIKVSLLFFILSCSNRNPRTINFLERKLTPWGQDILISTYSDLKILDTNEEIHTLDFPSRVYYCKFTIYNEILYVLVENLKQKEFQILSKNKFQEDWTLVASIERKTFHGYWPVFFVVNDFSFYIVLDHYLYEIKNNNIIKYDFTDIIENDNNHASLEEEFPVCLFSTNENLYLTYPGWECQGVVFRVPIEDGILKKGYDFEYISWWGSPFFIKEDLDGTIWYYSSCDHMGLDSCNLEVYNPNTDDFNTLFSLKYKINNKDVIIACPLDEFSPEKFFLSQDLHLYSYKNFNYEQIDDFNTKLNKISKKSPIILDILYLENKNSYLILTPENILKIDDNICKEIQFD